MNKFIKTKYMYYNHTYLLQFTGDNGTVMNNLFELYYRERGKSSIVTISRSITNLSKFKFKNALEDLEKGGAIEIVKRPSDNDYNYSINIITEKIITYYQVKLGQKLGQNVQVNAN